MQQFLIYEGKVAVIMTVFYLFFRVMLSKEKLHRLNRAVLVCTVLVSFLLPLCVITVHKTLPAPSLAAVEAGKSLAESLPEAIVTKAPFNWWGLLTIVYFLGVIAFMAKIGVDLINLKRLISRGEHHKDESGNVVVVLDEDVSPFSWKNFIFLSREDYEANCNHILEHERAHIRLGHAKELFCIELLSSLQWFSPAMWYLKSDLKAIYEYEADDAVLRGGANIKEYQYSLIRKAVSTSGYTITNSFNHSILKNRITMMSKSKTPLTRSLKLLYALPLLCGALALNARTVVDYDNSGIPTTVQQTPGGESVPFHKVEVKPTFQGGDTDQFSKWVNENLRYPASAKEAKIQGKVTLQFIVAQTGKVENVKVLRGVDPALDAEAVRVVSASPDWTPGKVKGEKVNVTYTFPVIFQLGDNAGQVEPGVVEDVIVVAYGKKLTSRIL